MRIRKRLGLMTASVLALALLAAACSSNDSGGGGSSGSATFDGSPLTGAGSTFAAPIYQLWAQSFLKVESKTQLNYQSIGSGGGIEQFTQQTVQFGATDVPLQSDEASALPSQNYIQFPTVLGAVVLAYNVPGVDSGLKLDGPTIADIFLGKITNWNDKAIADQNPDVTLPDLSIKVVHRSDESGTTAVWTQWLVDESRTWADQVGADKAVQWPVGTGGNGNEGVSAGVKQTEGAVGYLSFDYAVTANLGVADIKAPDGSYVAPSIESISKAGGGLSFPIKPDTNILNSKTTGAYPVASTTYVLIYQQQQDEAAAQALVDFWTWALTTGQQQTDQINYAPLPSDFAGSALAELGKISVNGQPVSPSAGVSG